MHDWFKQLDRIIRGDATKMRAMEGGQLELSVSGVSLALLILAVFAGLCVGSFGLVRVGLSGLPQMFSSAVKIPLVFFLSIFVTFPSLYVFNALAGSRLTLTSILKLMVVMLSVMIALLASLGPIIFFFGLSTTSYPVYEASQCGRRFDRRRLWARIFYEGHAPQAWSIAHQGA